MTALRMATGAAIVLTFGLIVLGALVRATGSGLSCPDWPTCYGHMLPLPSDIPDSAGYTYGQVMLEWVHRLIAGVILGPLILAITFLCWRVRDARPRLALHGALLLGLLVVQALLGGVTVLDQNSPWSVALHLGTALLLFSALWLILVRAGPPGAAQEGHGRRLSVVAWGLALATMVSAAVVSKSGASLACASWPLCNAGLVPDLSEHAIVLNVTHRSLAALFLLSAVALWSRLRPTPLHRAATLIVALTVAEVLLGGLIVVLQIPIWGGVAHQALGVLTFAAVNFVMWRALGAPAPATAGQGSRHAELVGTEVAR